MTTDAKEPESVRALQRIRELSADVDAWVAWSVDGALLEAYPGELLDHIATLTQQRDDAVRDRERLDWLHSHIDGIHLEVHNYGESYGGELSATVFTFNGEYSAKTVRDAIDAARTADAGARNG